MEKETKEKDMRKIDFDECVLIGFREEFCKNCGTKLVKTRWSDEIKYDKETGKPYTQFTFICQFGVEQRKILKEKLPI